MNISDWVEYHLGAELRLRLNCLDDFQFDAADVQQNLLRLTTKNAGRITVVAAEAHHENMLAVLEGDDVITDVFVPERTGGRMMIHNRGVLGRVDVNGAVEVGPVESMRLLMGDEAATVYASLPQKKIADVLAHINGDTATEDRDDDGHE